MVQALQHPKPREMLPSRKPLTLRAAHACRASSAILLHSLETSLMSRPGRSYAPPWLRHFHI